MAQTAWPGPDRRELIGKRTSRLDGPMKATGAARYAYDINRDNLLYAKAVQAPYGVAKVLNVDTADAERIPGVVTVRVETDRRGNLPEVTHDGTIIATVVAETEEIAHEAVKKVKVEYEVGDPQMNDTDPDLAEGRAQEEEAGDVEAGMNEADKVSEGQYGISVITHCCLESHGQVMEFREGELYVWPSTQNVSGFDGGLRRDADLDQDKIHVDCQFMGGGFGSKFAADQWGSICTHLAKETGRPVKFMLERDQELKVAGARPSAFANVKIGVKNDGTVTAWDSNCWGSSGVQRWRMPPLPYIFTKIPNWKVFGKGMTTNRGAVRAWRAPNHPQGCLISMSAMTDAAGAIGMDALEFFKKNAELTEMPDTYREQLDIAADLIGYSQKAHLPGDKTSGPVKRGVGIAMHTWGGQGHPSACDVTVNPDGSVTATCGTQDLGTGTRTAIAVVVADSLGIPLEMVTVNIGRDAYPQSGASGGSTTIGGVSSSSRAASVKCLNAIIEKAAPELGVEAGKLEAWDGKIQEIGNSSNNMSWKDACKLLGQMSITKQGNNPPEDGTELTTSGVGGVQMADVSVDMETGVVTMNEMVAVQDCGLIIDLKTAESQVYGALIMGITYSLYEEGIYDPTTGAMLNPDMEFYRLAGLGDVGTLKVHMMTDEKYQGRGVIGLGEPPVISPGAAISNAVHNALGVRVPRLPLTPDRVVQAVNGGGSLA